VDITKIGLRDLRRSIAIIPQTPQLFNGTIRFNVDPLGHATDDQIWRTLELVQLRELIDEIEGGLDAEVDEGGSNISVGS
jgi:ABC-type multidrug transport system fused ATPase/permease subunit